MLTACFIDQRLHCVHTNQTVTYHYHDAKEHQTRTYERGGETAASDFHEDWQDS
jgi:hypothetical protein